MCGMQNIKIYKRRINQFIDTVYAQRYSDRVPLKTTYIYTDGEPIPYKKALTAKVMTFTIVTLIPVWAPASSS